MPSQQTMSRVMSKVPCLENKRAGCAESPMNLNRSERRRACPGLGAVRARPGLALGDEPPHRPTTPSPPCHAAGRGLPDGRAAAPRPRRLAAPREPTPSRQRRSSSRRARRGAFRVPAGHFFRIALARRTAGRRPQPLGGRRPLANGSSRARPGRCTARTSRPATASGRRLPYLRPMATIIEDSLDWYGTDALGRPRPRRDRHPLRSLHQPAPDRRRLPPLLPLEPDPRARRGDRPAARRGRAARPRRPQRLHVHRLRPRHRAATS